MTAATLLVLQASLGYCDDYENANSRQCNCPYMWMRMNSGGPQVTGLGLWLLVGVGLTALLLSVDISSVNSRHNTIKTQ